jgi:hypothetical protein
MTVTGIAALGDTNRDPYQTARLLMEFYGEDALRFAVKGAIASLERRDPDAVARWRLVVKAVRCLTPESRPEGQPLH